MGFSRDLDEARYRSMARKQGFRLSKYQNNYPNYEYLIPNASFTSATSNITLTDMHLNTAAGTPQEDPHRPPQPLTQVDLLFADVDRFLAPGRKELEATLGPHHRPNRSLEDHQQIEKRRRWEENMVRKMQQL